MTTPIASLFIEIGADADNALKAFTDIENRIDGFTTLSNKALPASAALAAGGTLIAAGFADAIGQAAQFQAQMNAVRAVMSPAEVAQFGGSLDKLALQLGADTKFSALEAAAGIEELIKAGVPAPAVLGGAAKAALDLAAATGIPVAQSATVASQVMNAYHKDVSQLAGVVDFLAGTANASAADMTDLGFGLRAVGSVAPLVGLSFEDTATALGLFANNALIGQDAGTSFKTLLLNLQPQTKQAAALMKSLGLETADGANLFFDASGKLKPLAEIAGVLQEKLGKLNPAQQQDALKKLFGTDAIRAAGILLQEGSAGVEKLQTAIGGIGADQTAAQRMAGLSGAVERMNGSLQTAAITIGNAFLPVLTTVVGWIDHLVDGFTQLPAPVQTALVGLVALTGIGLLVVGGLGLMAFAVVTLTTSFAALGGALTVIETAFAATFVALAPVLLAIGAAIAIGALLYTAWTSDFLGIQEITASVGGAVAGFFTGTLLPALQAVSGWIGEHVLPLVQALADLGFAVLQAKIEAFMRVWNGVLWPGLQLVGQYLESTVLAPIRTLLDLFGQALGLVAKLAPALVGLLPGNFQEVLKTLQALGGAPEGAGGLLDAGTANVRSAAADVRAQTAGGGVTVQGPLVQTGPITNEADEQRMAATVAAVLARAEDRVSTPIATGLAGAYPR